MKTRIGFVIGLCFFQLVFLSCTQKYKIAPQGGQIITEKQICFNTLEINKDLLQEKLKLAAHEEITSVKENKTVEILDSKGVATLSGGQGKKELTITYKTEGGSIWTRILPVYLDTIQPKVFFEYPSIYGTGANQKATDLDMTNGTAYALDIRLDQEESIPDCGPVAVEIDELSSGTLVKTQKTLIETGTRLKYPLTWDQGNKEITFRIKNVRDGAGNYGNTQGSNLFNSFATLVAGQEYIDPDKVSVETAVFDSVISPTFEDKNGNLYTNNKSGGISVLYDVTGDKKPDTVFKLIPNARTMFVDEDSYFYYSRSLKVYRDRIVSYNPVAGNPVLQSAPELVIDRPEDWNVLYFRKNNQGILEGLVYIPTECRILFLDLQNLPSTSLTRVAGGICPPIKDSMPEAGKLLDVLPEGTSPLDLNAFYGVQGLWFNENTLYISREGNGIQHAVFKLAIVRDAAGKISELKAKAQKVNTGWGSKIVYSASTSQPSSGDLYVFTSGSMGWIRDDGTRFTNHASTPVAVTADFDGTPNTGEGQTRIPYSTLPGVSWGDGAGFSNCRIKMGDTCALFYNANSGKIFKLHQTAGVFTAEPLASFGHDVSAPSPLNSILSRPSSMLFKNVGSTPTLFFADRFNDKIKKMNLSTGQITDYVPMFSSYTSSHPFLVKNYSYDDYIYLGFRDHFHRYDPGTGAEDSSWRVGGNPSTTAQHYVPGAVAPRNHSSLLNRAPEEIYFEWGTHGAISESNQFYYSAGTYLWNGSDTQERTQTLFSLNLNDLAKSNTHRVLLGVTAPYDATGVQHEKLCNQYNSAFLWTSFDPSKTDLGRDHCGANPSTPAYTSFDEGGARQMGTVQYVRPWKDRFVLYREAQMDTPLVLYYPDGVGNHYDSATGAFKMSSGLNQKIIPLMTHLDAGKTAQVQTTQVYNPTIGRSFGDSPFGALFVIDEDLSNNDKLVFYFLLKKTVGGVSGYQLLRYMLDATDKANPVAKICGPSDPNKITTFPINWSYGDYAKINGQHFVFINNPQTHQIYKLKLDMLDLITCDPAKVAAPAPIAVPQ